MTYENYTRGNGVERNAREIQSDLGEIRSEIDHTLDALSQQLAPGQLLHQALDAVRQGGGGRFMRNFSRTIEDNPVPLAMIAAGFGYLLYSDRNRRRDAEDPFSHRAGERGASNVDDPYDFEAIGPYEGSEAGGDAGAEGRHEEGQRLSEGVGRAREGAKHLQENLRHGIEGAKGRLAEGRRRAGGQLSRASHRARDARDWGQDMVHEQPLVLAGLGLALGAAAAALVPMSRKEHDVMGGTGRKLRTQVKEAAGEAGDRAKAVGESALAAAKEAGTSEAKSQKSELESSPGGPHDEHAGSGHEARDDRQEAARALEQPQATYAPSSSITPDHMQDTAARGAADRSGSVTLSYSEGTFSGKPTDKKA